MRARLAISLALAALTLAAPVTRAADAIDPAGDAKAFRDYFEKKFPKVKFEDFVNGPYSMNEDMRKQWEDKEQFPPYEFALDAGKEMFTKPFKNGKTYADCFPNGGIGVRMRSHDGSTQYGVVYGIVDDGEPRRIEQFRQRLRLDQPRKGARSAGDICRAA